jgi:hypothetical protein
MGYGARDMGHGTRGPICADASSGWDGGSLEIGISPSRGFRFRIRISRVPKVEDLP